MLSTAPDVGKKQSSRPNGIISNHEGVHEVINAMVEWGEILTSFSKIRCLVQRPLYECGNVLFFAIITMCYCTVFSKILPISAKIAALMQLTRGMMMFRFCRKLKKAQDPCRNMTSAAQKIKTLLETAERNNLTADLLSSPRALESSAAWLKKKNINIKGLSLLRTGSTGIAMKTEDNQVVKFSRPHSGDKVLQNLTHGRGLFLLPSDKTEIPVENGDTLKVETMPRVMMSQEMIESLSSQMTIKNAKEIVRTEIDDFARLAHAACVKDGYLLSDKTPANIGFMMTPSGKPVTCEGDNGERRLVPTMIDYEKICPIPQAELDKGHYREIREHNLPFSYDAISKAILHTCESFKAAHGGNCHNSITSAPAVQCARPTAVNVAPTKCAL